MTEPADAPSAAPPREEVAHWAVLYDVNALTSAKTFDLERSQASVLEVALKLAGGEAGAVLLQEKANQDLVVQTQLHVDADAVLEDQRVLEAVQEAVGDLPEREQLVISMYFHRDLTLKEIAQVLSVSEGRACQLKTQALLRMRGMLASRGLLAEGEA